MNAMEKAAWTELLVVVTAMAIALVLIPWLGNRASAAFGFLGFLPLGMLFLRQRGQGVLVDERDREIDKEALRLGVSTAWMMLFTAIILLQQWSVFFNDRIVPIGYITWIIWIQFAICYGVKGLVSILAYRRQRHAA